MNPRFKTNLIEHIKAVSSWAGRHGATATVDALTFALSLQVKGERLTLHPQFVGKRPGGQLMYSDQADAFAVGFVGWLPYRPLTWDISLSKLAFKQLAQALGLDTPAHWQGAAATATIDVPCLVKRARGAFGYGMRGPFSTAQRVAELERQPLQEGEYLEAFHAGRIARAWYWSGRLAVLEVFDMPQVTGDGTSRVQELLLRRTAEVPDDLGALLQLQGVGADTVLAAGQRVVCDYRYVSPFNPTVYANSNVLHRLAGTALRQRFEQAGQRLWPHIGAPAGAAGRHAGYVLDAIVDADDRPWFLEVNSNAQGHPDLYAPMLDQLCAPALAQAIAA